VTIQLILFNGQLSTAGRNLNGPQIDAVYTSGAVHALIEAVAVR
jgi:hypothetical protein